MSFHIRRDYSAVPVLMFHSIGIKGLPWIWSDMSEDVEVFRGVLEGLAADGYRTVTLEDLYAYMAGRTGLPEKPVVLTFDDGYLDNWINAVPLLRDHGMRATVYVTPEFVPDSSVLCGAGTDDEANQRAEAGQDVAGFMSWRELRAADTEGVLDVQSHALTHTWYFAGPRIVDIHKPADIYPYPWMSWNANPDRKPYYLTENQQALVPWGHPVLEHEKALIVRRYVPDQHYIGEVCQFVHERGGAQFFRDENWKRSLSDRFPAIGGAAEIPGTIESESAYQARVRHELASSKEIIESRLRKTVEFLAWPGGGVNETAAGLARNVGYKSWTLSSWQERHKKNRPGADPEGIKRVTGRSKVFFRSKWIANGGAWWVLHRLRAHQGSIASKMATAGMKLKWLTLGGREVR